MVYKRLVAGVMAVASCVVIGAQGEEKFVPRDPIEAPEPEPKSKNAVTVRISTIKYRGWGESRDGYSNALPELVAHIRKEAPEIRNRIMLDDDGLSRLDKESPPTLLYITGSGAKMNFNQREKDVLRAYLQQGGLMFAESLRRSSSSPFVRQIQALMKEILSAGRFSKLPPSHPLNSSYYDFDAGPPGQRQDAAVEIFTLRGRTAVILSSLNLSRTWSSSESGTRVRGLQYGTNIIAFAITNCSGG